MFTFDVVTIGPKIFEQGLKEVLESTSIRKIFFDCRCASDLLFHRYGVRLDGVFDVQAANAIILTWAYTGGYIPAYSYSLPHLARTYLGIQVKRCSSKRFGLPNRQSGRMVKLPYKQF